MANRLRPRGPGCDRVLSTLIAAMLVPTVVGFHSFEIPNAGDETCALSMKQMTHSGRVAALGTGGPKRKVTHLRQTDFQGGTYRIRESGVYVLTEDIYFGPRPDNDYWPEPEDANYPASQFYLGFFAGITVEADNVEIDLNGHTLAQNKEFYLLQRFWNAIELANRVFVDNEGVASLNFQEGDKEQFQTGRVPVTRGASNVYIHDGTLGLSSHSGIHGNNASKVHIEKVSIRDWEVSGIHLNGCRKCRVTRCTVGPTSWQVPARATFANARFLELYTSRLIPLGFRQEGVLDLLNATITFADRSPETVEAVFKRLGRAVKLFQDQYMDRLDKPSLSAEDVALLHDATKLFAPRVPVPDGSVIYGIIFNHLGVPGDDENHYGAGEEAAEIVIERTVIQNLTIKPGEVAAILHSDGKFAQGPIRDLFRVLEVVDNRLRTLDQAAYGGDVVHDTYFAMWQLANSYYEAQIYASGCGNFGSNATLPFAYDVGRCTQGVPQNPSLNGRDTVMLQKKYFGGLHLSEELFKWATTSGASLGDLFISREVLEDRYSSRHSLACDVDTMHHPMQGAIGLRLEEVREVRLERVEVTNLRNLGDRHGPPCMTSFRLLANAEDVVPERSVAEEGGGANARGLHLKISQDIRLKQVSVTDIDSDEGFAIGIDIAPDSNDRSDYGDLRAVKFDGVRAMVDSHRGITNLHVPSDIIIDNSMPTAIRAGGKMWNKDDKEEDFKACIPDRSYAGAFAECIDFCKKNGAFDPKTMGACPNVGLMAQKAEEYGSHPTTFEAPKNGTIRIVLKGSNQVLLGHRLQKGDIWRSCQTKDAPINDWVKLAVRRCQANDFPRNEKPCKAIFWLDPARAHDCQIMEKVHKYLPEVRTDGLDIEIMSPQQAMRVTCERAKQGMNTITVTGNVLRDYLTDLFPILELGTSAKMLSVVPMLAGGGMYETGAGGSAPKHVQQFTKENHLRWDSLGEYLALTCSIEDLARDTDNKAAATLAGALSRAVGRFLDANKNPSRKVKEIDNRGSHYWVARYWAEELAAQGEDQRLKETFSGMAEELKQKEAAILSDMIECQGKTVDIGGYYRVDKAKADVAMNPSATFNGIITRLAQGADARI